MYLVVNEFGSFLGKKSRRFVVKTKEQEQEVPVDDVDTIFVTAGGSISTAAIELAAEAFVDIVILDGIGKPIARVFPCTLGGTTLTRKKQAEASINRVGVQIAHGLVAAKILNQGYFLKSLAKTRPENAELDASADKILNWGKNLEVEADSIEGARQRLLGSEGAAAAEYFKALSTVIPMENRERRPATDPINALLNYGYGFLYSEGERACIGAGLDPFLGFYHADRYGKPCMVLDLVEPFRPVIVDRAVVTAWVQKTVKPEDFELQEETGGLRLTQEGRKKFCEAVLGRLNAEATIAGEKMSFKTTMLWQARQIARAIRGEEWVNFIYKW